MNYQKIVDNTITTFVSYVLLPLCELTNTDEDCFWYMGKDGKCSFDNGRYEHEKGKTGDIFYDGNNGDKWKVLAINTDYNRAIVENKTQGGKIFVYWE